MRNIFLIILATCCSVQQLQAQPLEPSAGRNPFLSSATGSEKPLKSVQSAQGAPALTLEGVAKGLPSLKAGIYVPPNSPPLPPPPLPLPRFVLPPSQERSSDSTLGPLRGKELGPQGEPPSDAVKSDVFLSRAQLQDQRGKCQVTLKSLGRMNIPSEGGSLLVRLAVIGGRHCVKGLASTAPWLKTSSMSDAGELNLGIERNEAAAIRSADVSIANIGTSITIKVTQAAAVLSEDEEE